MKLKKMLAGHLIVLGLIFPHTVSAEQFTFNVGVDLKNLHEDVDRIKVQCRVQTSETGAIIGRTSNDVSVPANGTLNTTLQVKFNVNSGISPEDAKFYRCFLFFQSDGGASALVQPENSTTCTGVSAEQLCPKPGTIFSGSQLSGPIP